MIGTIIKYIFGLFFILAIFFALKSSGVNTAISGQTAHFLAVFNFINGNIKNISAIFPWVVDVVLLFSAIIVIEIILMSWKIINFISKKLGH